MVKYPVPEGISQVFQVIRGSRGCTTIAEGFVPRSDTTSPCAASTVKEDGRGF